MKTFLFTLLATATVAFAAPTSPEVCQAKINGQPMDFTISQDGNGQGFFARASQISQQNGSCVYAKIDQMPYSGRVYFRGAKQAAYNQKKEGLSNSEASEAMRGLSCMTLSCIPLVYNKAPQYEQPVHIPSYPSTSPSGSDY